MQKAFQPIDVAWILIAPTRRIIDWIKDDDQPVPRGDKLRAWSFWLFVGELSAFVFLTLFVQGPPSPMSAWLYLPLLFWAWSRINEVCYAFYQDALTRTKRSNLERWERIRMAMRSFFALCFNFALFFYFLPIPDLFNRGLDGFWEAFYFSGVTLATLGYGDISPAHRISQALALWEVLAGILIVAVAIARYAGEEPDPPNAA